MGKKTATVTVAIGGIVLTGCATTQTVTTPGPTVKTTAKVSVPGPVTTKTIIKTVKVSVPGPVVTKTVQAPPPPAGTTIGAWSGSGNENTPAFYAPQSGDYVVSWSYSANNDPSLGGATNFIISATDSNASALGLPNNIASSGSGSTEVTGASGSESFNVQATGSWTISVKSAP